MTESVTIATRRKDEIKGGDKISSINATRFYADIKESFSKQEVRPSDAIAVLETYKYVLLRDTLPADVD